jgi:putative FmdB family regulatory protein
MPTYGYRCEKGHEFEVFQSMTDDPLLKCTVCKAPVRRIFYPVGIVFKGPGFYKTDSRGSSPSPESTAAVPAATAGDKPAEGDKAAPKPDARPAAKSDSKSDSKPARASKSEKKSA